MNKLGRFETVSESEEVCVRLDELKVGINDVKNHIIRVNDAHKIDYIVNKTCDHAGGRLIVKGEQAVCPMHDWRLNLNTLQYNSSHVCKEQVPFRMSEQGEVFIEDANKSLKNPFQSEKKGAVSLRWLNHAAVFIECNGTSIITDPWLFGPAFMTGWWLAAPSPQESVELLKKADYVYISHNHPDHLHAETLALLPRDITIITPKFRSGSSEKFLRNLGFTQVKALNFLDIFELTPGFQVSLLKSGDFRDDSGLYVCANGHELLLTVDSNFLNAHELPKNVDLLMTSFAGGASGFPLCYEGYTEEEKVAVLKRNRNAIKSNVLKYVQETTPRYYMPYAGMFSEYAERDKYIKDLNLKNTFGDYEKILGRLSVTTLRPDSAKVIEFRDGDLTSKAVETTYLDKEDCTYYINKFKEEFQYDPGAIVDYLKSSGFRGKQILQIIPTDDLHQEIVGKIIYADFYHDVYKVIDKEDLVAKVEGYKVMQLRIRAEVIMCVIENYLPWEDLSIGFQMRASRFPNEYESDFWYHFTNNYIAKEHFRYTSYCGACTIVNQNPVWVKDKQPLQYTP
ncbi:CMP-N-acetylneuraminate monooxygenase [Pontibacter ummariensis]|uniref:CMP-N-acetylneuraminate monooxygenase n=1 Tax=Pontibacter ummariensis TaxID=1610492 RepID=A0A239EK18_9BACT|nr:MBL fold metallo-hydrolase [Pontibacter ummariensis]PRY13301.1 CMP-N-acetylneuraminate monooxygenase [Pontibacter ummariensis]SNS44967.1 CMP-N-acetylneuraminate monooxygenase [Pontibacter ummariensis]